MKKTVAVALVSVLSLASFSGTYAGGFTYDQSDVDQAVESIKDKETKDIVARNLLPASQNNIAEDWEYNNKNYYTKKLLISVSIPEEIKAKVTSAYISLWTIPSGGIYPMYDSKLSGVSVSGTSNGTEFKISLNKDALPSEIKISRSELDSYVKDEYGASFNGKLVLELTDGTKLPYSNMVYFYITKDNTDGKINHLSNLYYAANPSSGYANTQDLLKAVFTKLQEKYKKPVEYITSLEKVNKKIDTKLEEVKADQKKLVEPVRGEEDFAKLIDPASKLADKLSILNDIKYQVGSEIKTRQSEGIINDLFSDDIK